MKIFNLFLLYFTFWQSLPNTHAANIPINPKVCEAYAASSQIHEELIKRYPPDEYFIIFSGRQSTLHWMTAWIKNPEGSNVNYFFHPYTDFHGTKNPSRLKYLNAILNFQSKENRKVLIFRELDGGGVVYAMNLDLIEIKNPSTSSSLSFACLASRPSQENSMRYSAIQNLGKNWHDLDTQSFLPKEIVLIRHDRFFEADVFRRASYDRPYVHTFSYLGLNPDDPKLSYLWLVEKHSTEEIEDILFQTDFTKYLVDLNLKQRLEENYRGTKTSWNLEFDSNETGCRQSFREHN